MRAKKPISASEQKKNDRNAAQAQKGAEKAAAKKQKEYEKAQANAEQNPNSTSAKKKADDAKAASRDAGREAEMIRAKRELDKAERSSAKAQAKAKQAEEKAKKKPNSQSAELAAAAKKLDAQKKADKAALIKAQREQDTRNLAYTENQKKKVPVYSEKEKQIGEAARNTNISPPITANAPPKPPIAAMPLATPPAQPVISHMPSAATLQIPPSTPMLPKTENPEPLTEAQKQEIRELRALENEHNKRAQEYEARLQATSLNPELDEEALSGLAREMAAETEESAIKLARQANVVYTNMSEAERKALVEAQRRRMQLLKEVQGKDNTNPSPP